MQKRSKKTNTKQVDRLAQQYYDHNCHFDVPEENSGSKGIFPIEGRFLITLLNYLNLFLGFGALCALIVTVSDQFSDLGITLWILTQDARVEPIGYFQK